MNTKLRLRIGATLHFIIAVGHLACLFFLEEAFKAYDILEEMNDLCFGQTWLMYVVTVAVAFAVAVAGLYGLSASGDIRRLPLQRMAITTILVVYSVWSFITIVSLFWTFSYLEMFSLFNPVILVWCYLPGMSAKQS